MQTYKERLNRGTSDEPLGLVPSTESPQAVLDEQLDALNRLHEAIRRLLHSPGSMRSDTRGRATTDHFGPPRTGDLPRSALDQLEEIDEAAAEEGYEPCSAVAKRNARRILLDAYREQPHDYDVYPTEHRQVAVLAQKDGRSVLVLCESDGGAACFVTIAGTNRRSRYDDAAALPDAFLLEALRELKN